MAEMSSYSRDYMAYKAWNIYNLALYKKRLLTSGLTKVVKPKSSFHLNFLLVS